MGDLLCAIANLSRKLGIEPEAALRRANEKFTRRFDAVEQAFIARGESLHAATLEEMEAEWRRGKAEGGRPSRKHTTKGTKHTKARQQTARTDADKRNHDGHDERQPRRRQHGVTKDTTQRTKDTKARTQTLQDTDAGQRSHDGHDVPRRPRRRARSEPPR